MKISLPAAALTLALAACGGGEQGAPGASAGATLSAAQVDTVLARAQRSRYKGLETAPATVVEVSDFQCPFCQQFAQQTYPRLDSAYVRTGRVRMLYINLPLGNHTRAFAAAEAALCAGAQGQYWPMHDRLFATQGEWGSATDVNARMEGYAADLRLDAAAFRDCTANDRTASIIMSDAIEAAAGGVNGTPAFFLVGPGGRRRLAGAVSWEQLQAEVEAVLTAAAPGAPAPSQPAPQPGTRG